MDGCDVTATVSKIGVTTLNIRVSVGQSPTYLTTTIRLQLFPIPNLSPYLSLMNGQACNNRNLTKP